jgi:hypothetical protein
MTPRRLWTLLAVLMASCGGDAKAPDSMKPIVIKTVFTAADATDSETWKPPADAPADPAHWVESPPLEAAYPIFAFLRVAVSAQGEVLVVYPVVRQGSAFGSVVRGATYNTAAGWGTPKTLFAPAGMDSDRSSFVVGAEVFEGGEALAVWYSARGADHQYYAGSYDPKTKSWGTPQPLGTAMNRHVVRDSPRTVRILLCGREWNSWTYEVGTGLSRATAPELSPQPPPGHENGPCVVALDNGVAKGLSIQGSDSSALGDPDSPVFYLHGSINEEVGPSEYTPGFAYGAGWATLLTPKKTFERAADGTWTTTDPLLDIYPSAWVAQLNVALFGEVKGGALALERGADGWRGPFVVHEHLASTLLLPGGDTATIMRVYGDDDGVTSPFTAAVQRRIAGVWQKKVSFDRAYAFEAATSSAGDLVLVRALGGALTVHATGPNFP